MKKLIILIFAFTLLFPTIINANDVFGTSVKVLKNKLVETDLNEELFRLAGNINEDMDFWKEVLPEIDKNLDKYLVIPDKGLVMPIVYLKPTDADYQNFISGKEIDFNPYLQKGAVEMPGTSKNGYGEEGNKVLSGHSSYLKSDKGRYKTHFQKIIGLPLETEIWIFEKETSGNGDVWKISKYKVTESFETEPTNIEVLKSTDKKTITLITCTPIGGVSGRWIVKGEYYEDFYVYQKIYPENKAAIDKIFKEIKSLESREEQIKEMKVIVDKFKDAISKKPDNEGYIRFYEYLIFRIKRDF